MSQYLQLNPVTFFSIYECSLSATCYKNNCFCSINIISVRHTQYITNIPMLFIIFTSLLSGLAMSQKYTCCQSKVVGTINYYLVDYTDTSEWGCKDNCVYATQEGGRVCFKSGPLTVTCQDNAGGGSAGGSWPQEPEVENTYIPKGEMVDLDPNMKGYLVGSGQKVVVWSADTAGITSEDTKKKTTKEWADFLAEKGGYTVLVPDWFRGNNAVGPYPQTDWTMQVTNWTRIQSDWKNVVLPYLETKLTAPLSIGLIGTC